MTVAYSSENPDHSFEGKLYSRRIRIDCFLQTATKSPPLWVFKIKAEIQVSNIDKVEHVILKHENKTKNLLWSRR